VQSVLETSGVFLTDSQAATLDAAMHDLLTNYHYLAAWHMREGRIRYNVTFKCHYAYHLAAMGSTINPFRLSTYTEESYIATGARFYNHGAFGNRTQAVVLEKYLMALQLRLVVPWLLL
jgi:hypothetical protein